jgi:spermidine synthase
MREFLSAADAGSGGGMAAGSGDAAPGGRRLIHERYSRTSGWFYEAGETLHGGKTEFQEIEVVRTAEFGTTLLLDGATQVMEASEFQYHEPMAHLALLAHPEPRRALIIGGGDGGLLREMLKHPSLEAVDFVELDAGVVEFARRHLPALGGAAFDDPRVRLTFSDGRAFVENSPAGAYDVVAMDMTDPAGPALMLYTAEFFRAVKRVLRDGRSFFVMHTESPETRPAAFARIRRTLASVFPVVRGAYAFTRMYGTFWSFAVCSPAVDAGAVQQETLRARLVDRGIGNLKLVSAETWPALFARYPYIEELLAGGGPISTDAAPEFPDSFDPRD